MSLKKRCLKKYLYIVLPSVTKVYLRSEGHSIQYTLVTEFTSPHNDILKNMHHDHHYEKVCVAKTSDTEQHCVQQSTCDPLCSLKATVCTQCSGTKLISGPSPRIREVRLSDGEGNAKRKAGLIECSESLFLPMLNGGQGATAT